MFTKSALVSLSTLSLYFLSAYASPLPHNNEEPECGTASTTTSFVTVTSTAHSSSSTTASSHSSGSTNSASTSTIGNFGHCSTPKIIFAAGLDGRKETAYEPADKKSYNHGSADAIDVISSFICNAVNQQCGADATAKATCTKATAAADAAAKGTGAQADAFNAAFGISTTFVDVTEITNTGKAVAGTGSSSSSSSSNSGSSSSSSNSGSSGSSKSGSSGSSSSSSGSSSSSSGNNAATSTSNSTNTGGQGLSATDPDVIAAQSSTTLDPRVISTGFEQDGQANATAGQVPSATSSNNFMNFCLTIDKPLTNGGQNPAGSCNTAIMGVIASKDNMPSSKFVFPTNFGTIKANTQFDIQMAIQHLNTGHFTNAELNYYAAPQTVDGNGDITGHTHFTVELLSDIAQTTPTNPGNFAFFKGINDPAVNGIVSTTVTKGLPEGVYRVASINAAANHQPALVAIAQHGALDDMTYFFVTADGKPPAGQPGSTGSSTESSSSVAATATGKGAASATDSVTATATDSESASATGTAVESATDASATATTTASSDKGSKGGKSSSATATGTDSVSATETGKGTATATGTAVASGTTQNLSASETASVSTSASSESTSFSTVAVVSESVPPQKNPTRPTPIAHEGGPAN